MSLDNTDMWGEILVRLPAECLFRARAVCKGFRAVIDEPCFVRAHTKNHQHQLSSNFMIRDSIYVPSAAISYYSLDLEALISCSNQGHQAVAATPLDHLEIVSYSQHRFPGRRRRVAACNGLVLTQKPFTIWNPLTHERLRLPRGHIKYVRAFGLEYDSTTDDYKAVVILGCRETRVYSLKSDSWRTIMNCCSSLGPVGPGVFVCGALNWLSVGERSACDEKIVALGLGTEKYYGPLQMPPRQTKRGKPRYPNDVLLNVLGGCLALCDSSYLGHLGVWVMKVYGDGDSWTKLLSIDRSQQHCSFRWRGFLRLAAKVTKEKFVFLEQGFYRFFQFDVETKSLETLEMDDSSIPKVGSFFCRYARQLFVGNIFRLHANCGGGVRKIDYSKKKKENKKKKKKASAADVE